MKIGFYVYQLPLSDPVARGFLTTSINLYLGLKEAGIEVVPIGPRNQHKRHLRKGGVDQIVHFCPPHKFNTSGLEWAQNLLFTMWEAPVLPERSGERNEFDLWGNIRRADAVMVPSSFVQRVFEQYTGVKATVNPLGVAPIFCQAKTQRPILRGAGCPRLRVLFVGANNPRKGQHLIAPAWNKVFSGSRASAHVQLYIKILGAGVEQEVQNPYGDERVIIDQRDLTVEQLAALYESADVFLFPSMGEGFGLPPLEAMASGALACSTNTGGLSEFIRETTAIVIPRPSKQTMRYGIEWEELIATPDSIALCLKAIWDQWGASAAESIRKNGTSVARSFTWANTVKRLLSWAEREKSHGKTMLRGGYQDGRQAPIILGTPY